MQRGPAALVTVLSVAVAVFAVGFTLLQAPGLLALNASIAGLAGLAAVLGSRGHALAGGMVLSLACALTPYVGFYTPEPDTTATAELTWMLTTVLVAGITLPLRAYAVLGMVNLVIIFGLMNHNDGIPLGPAVEVVVMMALVTLLTALIVLMRGRDQAELERHAALVERAKTRAEAAIESVADALLIVDPDGRITHANQAAIELLGYPLGELVDTFLAALFTDGQSAALLIDRIRNREERDEQVQLVASDGLHIPASMRTRAMRSSEGAFLGAVCVARDTRPAHGVG